VGCELRLASGLMSQISLKTFQ